MPSTHSLWRVPVASFIAGVVVGGSGALAVTSASAAEESSGLAQGVPTAADKAPKCIRNGDYGAILAEENRRKSGNQAISGTRARIWVPPKGTSCQRISSIYGASKSLATRLEFGVVVGWSNCTRQRYERPQIFAWVTKKGQYLDGSVGSKITPKQYDTPGDPGRSHSSWQPRTVPFRLTVPSLI